MDKITFFDITNINGSETFVMIDHGNGEFTSMPKSAYDEQQAAAVNDTNEL